MNKKFYGIALCSLLSLAATPSMASKGISFQVENEYPDTYAVKLNISAYQNSPYNITTSVLTENVKAPTGKKVYFGVYVGDIAKIHRFNDGLWQSFGFTKENMGYAVELVAVNPEEKVSHSCRVRPGSRMNIDDVINALTDTHYKIEAGKDACTEIK